MVDLANMNLENNKLSSIHEALQSEAFYFQKFRNAVVGVPLPELITYIQNISESEEQSALNRLKFYLLMFNEIPEVQMLLNAPEFPDEILEHIVLRSFYTEVVNYCLQPHARKFSWDFLSGDKLLFLLLKSQYIREDSYISLHLLVYLDNKYFDLYLSRKKGVSKFLVSIIKHTEYNTMLRMFTLYPVFYGYIYWILQDAHEPELCELAKKYEASIQDAKMAYEIIDHLAETAISRPRYPMMETESSNAINRYKIQAIKEKLPGNGRDESVLALLRSNKIFENDQEYELLVSITRDAPENINFIQSS